MKKMNRGERIRNFILVVLSLGAAYWLAHYEPFHNFLLNLGSWEYIGAYFAGAAFSSIFSIATATVVLLVLAENLPPWQVGVVAGLGAACADVLILKFLKATVVPEARKLLAKMKSNAFLKRLGYKYMAWTLPLIGFLIVMSPFPDEIGMTLIGLSGMKTHQFFFISFVLNSIMIGLIASASPLLNL